MIFENIFQKQKSESKKFSKPKITADQREKNSLVISELIEQGAEVEMKHLKVADFIIGKTAVERKTISDFLSSMISRRLIRQLQEIKQYPLNFLLIEGIEENELYHKESSVHPNAVRGFLLDIILKYKVPIIFTKDYKDTAKFLIILAKKSKTEISLRAKKKAKSKKEQMQYILEGFPGIGPKTAKKLLKHCKSLKNITNTKLEDLEKLIGKKANIFRILDEKY